MLYFLCVKKSVCALVCNVNDHLRTVAYCRLGIIKSRNSQYEVNSQEHVDYYDDISLHGSVSSLVEKWVMQGLFKK